MKILIVDGTVSDTGAKLNVVLLLSLSGGTNGATLEMGTIASTRIVGKVAVETATSLAKGGMV